MGFLELRSSIKALNPADARRSACVRSEPECVVLPVGAGVSPNDAPPVRIFLGTEPGQYRAERIFVYSIEQYRNPSRVYEIHLMKDLAGFDRRGWTTGFTNYRFAVPYLAGRWGRAIFNDVDEVYLGDPADLFDADLGDHGYLATSDTETSVMLIDCERMAPIWSLEACRHELKKQLLARTLKHHPGVRGDLPPEWTARDEDFVPGFSKLQHWTTLQTQPWRPVPGRFVYQPNSTGQIWFDMKRKADASGYQIFDASRPSSLYRSLLARLGDTSRPAPGPSPPVSVRGERLHEVAERVQARTVLYYGLGRSAEDADADRLGLGDSIRVLRFDLTAPATEEPCDGVVCEEVLEFIPDEDAPGVIDDLFERATRFVYAVVGNDTRSERLSDGSELASHPRDASWWIEHFETAARRHPELHWTLVLDERRVRGSGTVRVRDGGDPCGRSPSVWVLSDAELESTSQVLALAEALGWPYEHKVLRFSLLGRIDRWLLGASTRAVDWDHSPSLAPPWPDFVISSGGRCVPVALWIREQDQGRTRLVHVGRDGGETASLFDAVVTPAYSRLWPHPHRIETAALLTRPPERPTAWQKPADEPFGEAPEPHILLLLDAPAGARLDPDAVGRMGLAVHRTAQQAGGSVRAVAGAGVGALAVAALAQGVGGSDRVESIDRSAEGAAVCDRIAAADVVVVAGNDALLVSEAVSGSRPVYIYPLPSRTLPFRGLRPDQQLRERIAQRANARPVNARGTARPQQGLEYLAARLIERGIVRPPTHLDELYQQLYQRGVAQPFGAALRFGDRPALHEADEAASRVRDLLGHPSTATGA
jgi:hypothetical protein